MSDLAAQVGSPGLHGVGRLSSDERLTTRAAAGDPRAFAAIFRRYHQDLYRYCAAILGDSQDAQDALQNTMVKVMRALPDEQRQIRLKPWLYRIAHNESIDLVRARRQTQALDPGLEAPGAEPAEKAEQRARLQRLLADLEDLPERQRGALLMRELGGLSFEEIGAVLGASSAVARQTIYEARLNLKQMNAGRDTSCDAVTRALSDADGRVARRRDIRAHLRQCEGCRAFRDQIKQRHADLAAIAPLPAAAATGILHTILGGHGPGGGILGALGGGASKAVGGSVAVKSAAAVVAISVVGAGVADRSGLIHVGSSGGGSASGAAAGESSAPPAGAVRDSVPGAGSKATGMTSGSPASSARHGTGAGRAGLVPQAGNGSAPSTVPSTPPEHDGTTADQMHAQDAQPSLPTASADGQETAAAHKGEAAPPAHPAPPQSPEPPAHPTPESHPGANGHSTPAPPSAASAAGEAAAGGNPPKAPPASTAPAEQGAGGAGGAGAGAGGSGEHGPPAEPGPGEHGPPGH